MNISKSSHRGFTVIELLVVIAIIATLAAIAIPISLRVMGNAKKEEARSTMKKMSLAFNQFYDDHGSLEYGMNYEQYYAKTARSGATRPAERGHWRYFVALGGVRINNSGIHTRTKRNYLEGIPDAEGMRTPNPFGGLWRQDSTDNRAEGLFDPWGTPYFAQLDNDLDGSITVNSSSGLGANHDGKKAKMGNDVYLLISAGPDKLWSTDDDIVSHLYE